MTPDQIADALVKYAEWLGLREQLAAKDAQLAEALKSRDDERARCQAVYGELARLRSARPSLEPTECAHGHSTRKVGCVSCVLVFDHERSPEPTLRQALEHLARVYQASEDEPASYYADCAKCGVEVGWPIEAEGWPAEPICEPCVVKAALASVSPPPQEK